MNFRRSRTRSRRSSINIMSSTEKWRNYSKRISRRNTDFFVDDCIEDEQKINELKEWVEEFFTRKTSHKCSSDEDIEVFLTRKQTLILSTLVPDEILLMEKFDTAHPKHFVGVLLMADVSGYTALTERYNNFGKNGTYRLTVTLNTYIGSLIEVIYSHGGDIIKFAGDAFLALWKTDKRTFISHTIHAVIACALIIQHSYGAYETDVKVNLKVKLAIAAGNIIFVPIGTGIDMNYIIIGLPVTEAKEAESVCASGEVILSPAAWGHCYTRNYDYICHENGFVTIKAILYDPRENDVTKPFTSFGAMVRQVKKPLSFKNYPDNLTDSSNSITNFLRNSEMYSLRKSILVAEEKNIGSQLRKFMIRPVLTQIDAHQPLEYLTEMRQVTVLFITLKPRDCNYPQLITIVNNAYQITCNIVYKSMGCVNKIILFDKDVMILVIFGLRGFKHESEAQAALKCSYSIKKSVTALDGVSEVSIGVTTGQVYCGVVGHPLRREFTVIGAIVNKAARFMCGFRNKITCDEFTFVKSKMSSNGFTLQPPTALKGILHPGKIYEYTEEIRVKELYDIPTIPPLLDRTEEMEYLKNWLDDSHTCPRNIDAVLIIGEPRIGKTRLLEWMARYVQNQELRVCYISLTSVHSASPYLALSQIVNQILDLKEPIVGFKKEEKIVQVLESYDEDLCYLNNIIKVRFAYHEGIYSQDDNIRKEKAKNVFTKLIRSVSEKCVVFLDDLQNLDGLSWDFISIMFNFLNIYTVLTVTRGKFNSVGKWLYSVFINDRIRKIRLGPLTPSWIVPLACQILDVDAVPRDLCHSLRIKCNGMPGLIESFIVHLFSIGALEIKKVPDSELSSWENENLQFPDSSLVRPVAINTKDQLSLDERVQENVTSEIAIGIITQKEELTIDINLQSLDTLVMIQIDSLTPYQQLLLKIASVIGNVVSRDLLESIMYENNPITTAKAIRRLFLMRILCCANVKYNIDMKRITSITSCNLAHTDIPCDCCFEYDPENSHNLPKYAFCKVIKFKNRHSRETCYELLPINQKREFHSRVVNYLEKNKQKCTYCGGTIMIVQSSMSLQSEIPYSRKYESLNFYTYDNYDSDTEVDEFETEIMDNVQYTSFIKESIDIRKTRSEILERNISYSDFTKVANNDVSNQNSLISILSNKSTSQPILKRSIDNDVITSRRSNKRVTMSSFLYKDSSEVFNSKIYDMLRPVLEAHKISDWHKLGVIDSKDEIKKDDKNKRLRESINFNIEKDISQINLNKCTCTELNIVIHEQLIHHAIGAELKTKAVEFMIKYGFLNVIANNFINALPKLEEGELICKEMQRSDINDSNRKLLLGRIYSLKALSYLMNGKLSDAKLNIEKAQHIYHIKFGTLKNFLLFFNVFSKVILKRKKYLQYNRVIKSHSMFCLNVSALIYSTLGEERKSRSAILRALSLVQEVECNIIDMCDIFSNVIQMEIERGSPGSTIEAELLAKTVIEKSSSIIQADEIFAVGKLFMAIFRARMIRTNIAATIRAGYRALVISRFLQANDISIEIIPDLFYILLTRCRIKEAIDVLKLTIKLCRNQNSMDCETWYYALCIDIILDAGLQLKPIHVINRYAENVLIRSTSKGPSRRRLVANLWTYWLRAKSDRKAKRYESEALSCCTEEDDNDGTLTSLFSSMRLAEGMLESLARKVDDLKKVVDLMELRSLADKELTKLEKDAHTIRAVYPRWLLLKANSLNLSGRQSAAATTFNQAIDEARKVNNRLEEALAHAATSNSKQWIQSAEGGQFMKWDKWDVELNKASWHQLLYKITTTR